MLSLRHGWGVPAGGALATALLLLFGACTTSDSKGASTGGAALPGVTGTFLGSCSTTLDCCAQCFEYYSESATQAQRDQLQSNCPDYAQHCSTSGLQGRCVLPVGDLVPGLTTVDFRYQTTPSGGTYTNAQGSEDACLAEGGIWYPGSGTAPVTNDASTGPGGDPDGGSAGSGPAAGTPLEGVRAIAAGNFFTCALLQDRTVSCWGSINSHTTARPQTVAGISAATAIGAGAQHACAVVADGAVKCWGDNAGAQLGNGSVTASNAPVDVMSLTGATALGLGFSHSCALLEDSTVVCWGSESSGQIGDSKSSGYAFSPVAVPGLSDVTAISAEANSSTCALLKDGTVQCWGDNALGELGSGVTSSVAAPPAPVLSLTSATAISVGFGSCALVAGGEVYCWGEFGAKSPKKGTPLQVAGIVGATAIATGNDHACAVLSDGSVSCWGENNDYQLNAGPATTAVSAPVFVSGVTGAVALSAGQSHTCALLQDSTVTCWGDPTRSGRYHAPYVIVQ